MAIDLQIPIYPDEQDIGELIIKSSLISNLAEISLSKPFDISEGVQKIIASERQSIDLFYLQSILVSSVWNGNDELFLPSELWYSRNTAKDKPFNYEHVCDDIIGHMTSGYVIDDNGKALSSKTKVEDLPEVIHILNQAVLYRHWDDKELQARMDNIIEEISKNEWFVSVECLLPDFDYALKDKSGNVEIISRNKKTSFLTKHLRLFGGSGLFEGKRLARVPRNFIISGKGLVKKPANKDSIIIAKQLNLESVSLNSEEKNNLVYKSSDDLNIKAKTMNEAKELEYQAQIKTLTESLAKLQASISEGEIAKIKSELEVIKKESEAKNQEAQVLKASVEKLHSEKTELAKSYDVLMQEKTGLEKEIALNAEKTRTQNRLNAAKAIYKDAGDAEVFVENTNKMEDEAFEKFLNWNKNFMSNNSEAKVETKVEVTITPENKEQIVKASEIVNEPNLTIVSVDAKASEKKLIEDISKHMNTNYVKSGVQKFKLQEKK